MSGYRTRLSWFGLLLIVVGGVMLLGRLNVLAVSFTMALWSFAVIWGILIVGRGFSRNRGGHVFWGTVLFLYGLFFLLRQSDYVEVHEHVFVPATFLVFGIAFLMMFLNNFRDWHLLIPAIVLCGMGALLILVEYGFLYRWEVWDEVRTYWPLALILFGLAIMLRRRAQPPPA